MVAATAWAAGPCGASSKTDERFRISAPLVLAPPDRCRAQWQPDGEGTAFSALTVNGQSAAELSHNSRRYGEPEARPAAFLAVGSCLRELLEYFLPLTGTHPRPGVGDADQQISAFICSLDQNPTDGGELDGVADDVEKHLAKPGCIEVHHLRHRRADGDRHLDAFFVRPVGEHLDDALDQLARRGGNGTGRQPAGLERRKVEQIVDKLFQRLAGLTYPVEIAALRRLQRRAVQQMGHAEDAVQRRADFMADGCQQSRFGEILRFGRFSCRLALPLVLAHPGHVAGNAVYELPARYWIPDDRITPGKDPTVQRRGYLDIAAIGRA